MKLATIPFFLTVYSSLYQYSLLEKIHPFATWLDKNYLNLVDFIVNTKFPAVIKYQNKTTFLCYTHCKY